MFKVYDLCYYRSISPKFDTEIEALEWLDENVCSPEGVKVVRVRKGA